MLPGLCTVRAAQPSGLTHAICRPLVVQGEKRVTMGRQAFSFGAGDTLLITADIPTVSQITQATAATPDLSLVLELDPGIIAEMAAQMGPALVAAPAQIQVDPTAAEVADTAWRIMRLLDRPEAVPLLGGSLLHEVHYWLLVGRHGFAIRRMGWPDGHAQRIARAVALLRANYAGELPIEQLAAEAGMSPSSFHQHSKAVTSLSPLQFHKQLRLIEARRLMAAEGINASSAAYQVGYESVPQFTREYGRKFGLSPAADAEAARRRPEAA